MTTSKLPLTKRQREILDFILAENAQKQCVPDLTTIAQKFDLDQPNASRYLAQLVARGWLEKVDGIRYGFRVPQ